MEKGKNDNSSMWNSYNIKLKFIGRLCASVPSSEDIIESWLNSRKPAYIPRPEDLSETDTKSINDLKQESVARLQDIDEENKEIQKRTTLVFEQIDGHLAVRAATIRSHLKDCASQIQNQFLGRVKGERNFTTRVKNGLYIGGGVRDKFGTELILIKKNRKPVKNEDGFQERAIHVKGPSGSINALKRFAYIVRPTLEFDIRLLGKSVSEKDINMILSYGAVHGYGGERSMQEGQYQFDISKR